MTIYPFFPAPAVAKFKKGARRHSMVSTLVDVTSQLGELQTTLVTGDSFGELAILLLLLILLILILILILLILILILSVCLPQLTLLLLGELAILGRGTRTASVVAREPTRLLTITKTAYDNTIRLMTSMMVFASGPCRMLIRKGAVPSMSSDRKRYPAPLSRSLALSLSRSLALSLSLLLSLLLCLP
jgi:CRP-like cAMP-binding protein